ncbi:MAG: hypothetical protein ACRDPH_12130 [Marmoricola sp.]
MVDESLLEEIRALAALAVSEQDVTETAETIVGWRSRRWAPIWAP